MPAPKTTLSSLQGIEDRLRKLYGTAGSFGVQWEPNISLSVVAGSLTAPGTNLFRGRRWSWNSGLQTFGSAAMQAVSFTVPTIIDKVWCAGTNTVSWSVEMRGPLDGLVATPGRGVFFCEAFSPSIQSDYAPMYTSAIAAAAGAGANVLTIPNMQTTPQVFNVEWFVPGQLPDQIPGNYHQIVFRTGAAAASSFVWGCSGRLF